MRLAILLLAVALLQSCAGRPNCYIGIGFVPPMPVIMCGFDTEPLKEE